MEAPSCLSWSPALVEIIASLFHQMLCNMEPRDVTHFLLVLLLFLFCPHTEAFSYWCFMVSGFVTLSLSFLQLSEYFLLFTEGFVPSLAVTLWAQPSSHPGSKWAVESVRADCRPHLPTFPQCSLSSDQLSDFNQNI